MQCCIFYEMRSIHCLAIDYFSDIALNRAWLQSFEILRRMQWQDSENRCWMVVYQMAWISCVLEGNYHIQILM
jgi:hypothetical protein